MAETKLSQTGQESRIVCPIVNIALGSAGIRHERERFAIECRKIKTKESN